MEKCSHIHPPQAGFVQPGPRNLAALIRIVTKLGFQGDRQEPNSCSGGAATYGKEAEGSQITSCSSCSCVRVSGDEFFLSSLAPPLHSPAVYSASIVAVICLSSTLCSQAPKSTPNSHRFLNGSVLAPLKQAFDPCADLSVTRLAGNGSQEILIVNLKTSFRRKGNLPWVLRQLTLLTVALLISPCTVICPPY